MDPLYNNSFGSFGSGGAGGQSGMVSPGPDASPIIIGEKKSRKWVWAVVISLLLVGVGVGVFVMLRNKNNDISDFRELASYIEDIPDSYSWGDDDESKNEQNEWAYAVLISNQSMGVIQSYYDGLNKKYKDFLSASGKKLKKESIQEYGRVLMVLENAINYRRVGKDLIDAYDDSGISGAKKYFDENIQCAEGSVLDAVCQFEMMYYDMLIQEHSSGVEVSESWVYRNKFSNDIVKSVISAEIKEINTKVLEELNA